MLKTIIRRTLIREKIKKYNLEEKKIPVVI